jgi:hypothetical protein
MDFLTEEKQLVNEFSCRYAESKPNTWGFTSIKNMLLRANDHEVYMMNIAKNNVWLWNTNIARISLNA